MPYSWWEARGRRMSTSSPSFLTTLFREIAVTLLMHHSKHSTLLDLWMPLDDPWFAEEAEIPIKSLAMCTTSLPIVGWQVLAWSDREWEPRLLAWRMVNVGCLAARGMPKILILFVFEDFKVIKLISANLLLRCTTQQLGSSRSALRCQSTPSTDCAQSLLHRVSSTWPPGGNLAWRGPSPSIQARGHLPSFPPWLWRGATWLAVLHRWCNHSRCHLRSLPLLEV